MPNKVKPQLDALNIDLDTIADPNMRRTMVGLLNIDQQLNTENIQLREENQDLKDEVARLKGEQGRPNIKPNGKGGTKKSGDISSEKRRKQERKKKRKDRKKNKQKSKKVAIDRTVRCVVDPSELPEDAQYKGTEPTVIQDLVIRRDNILFEREKYWSPSLNKTFYGALPKEYRGHKFGPTIRSLALTLNYETTVSQPKILSFFKHLGIKMSAGKLSNLLIHDIQQFHDEKDEVLLAGLQSSPWQQTDDTGQRVNGINQYCHVLGNPLYSIYWTFPRKDRPTVLALLRGLETPHYLVNDNAVALAAAAGVSGAAVYMLQAVMPQNSEMDEATFIEHYNKRLSSFGVQTRRKLFEAAALAAYQAQTDAPIIDTLLADDARQFDRLTYNRALCWVHEGRHYAKMTAFFRPFQKELDDFQDRFWEYYRELRDYRKNPTAKEAERLDKAFDELFATRVDNKELQKRIEKTKKKKAELLLVLEHPEIPLHNNASELIVRQTKRKQDVSFGPRTSAGAKAWDTMQSMVGTVKKLDLNIYEYFQDRIMKRQEVPRLADVIRDQAQKLNLGASWGSESLHLRGALAAA